MNSNNSVKDVFPFFDSNSNTFSYVIKDPNSQACAVIDSVLDFDYAAGQIAYEGANKIIECIKAHNLTLECTARTWVTHAQFLAGKNRNPRHADRMSAPVSEAP